MCPTQLPGPCKVLRKWDIAGHYPIKAGAHFLRGYVETSGSFARRLRFGRRPTDHLLGFMRVPRRVASGQSE